MRHLLAIIEATRAQLDAAEETLCSIAPGSALSLEAPAPAGAPGEEEPVEEGSARLQGPPDCAQAGPALSPSGSPT